MEKKLPETIREIKEKIGEKTAFRLMFQDEARFGRIADTRRCWCQKPDRPLCPSMVSQEYTYAYGAVSIGDGQWDSLILPAVNTTCMQIFLNEVAERYPKDYIVMVLDGAGWHKSTGLHIPKNMQLLPLPSYSPELNPVENIWEGLREKNFHNRVFASIEAVELQLLSGLRRLEDNPEITKSISSWDWIINAILN
jgi:transposase